MKQKQTIKLNESQLRSIIKESIKKVLLNEYLEDFNGIDTDEFNDWYGTTGYKDDLSRGENHIADGRFELKRSGLSQDLINTILDLCDSYGLIIQPIKRDAIGYNKDNVVYFNDPGNGDGQLHLQFMATHKLSEEEQRQIDSFMSSIGFFGYEKGWKYPIKTYICSADYCHGKTTDQVRRDNLERDFNVRQKHDDFSNNTDSGTRWLREPNHYSPIYNDFEKMDNQRKKEQNDRDEFTKKTRRQFQSALGAADMRPLHSKNSLNRAGMKKSS